jgi:hypothetical protein
MNYILLISSLFLSSSILFAAPTKIKINGKFEVSEDFGGDTLEDYSVVLLQKNGGLNSKTLNESGKFSFRINKNQLNGASLFLKTPEGSYYGQILLKRSITEQTANMYFSGKPANKKRNSIVLGKISVFQNYALLNRAPNRKVLKTANITRTDSEGVPLGSGNLGFVDTLEGSVIINADEEAVNPGEDLDLDGVPNALDSDDDGDRVMDYADPDTAETTARDNLYTSLYLSMNETLNANVGDGLTESAINTVMEGENKFAFAFFYPVREGESFTGGHFECDRGLAYCNPDGSDSVYAGITESDPAVQNQNWFDYNDDGSPYNIESIRAGQVMVAAVQPRASITEFVAGQLMTAVLNTSSGSVRKPVAIGPFFVSVPAVKSYDAGFGNIEVDYSNSSEPGTGPGNPIILSATKTLRLTFWRPQRTGVSGAGEGEYVDMGNLHYGIIVGGLSTEFTCAGFYTGLSSSLTEDSNPLGEGDSPFSNQGARLWPLTDSDADSEIDVNNTVSFTVDLDDCLTRAGESTSGTLQLSLTAAGADLSGGASRGAQMLYVQLP